MKSQEAIGGYFEFELGRGNTFHPNSIFLNSGRNALEYALKALQIKRVYLAYFSCEVVLEPIDKLEIPYVFYNVDENLEPIFEFAKLTEGDAFIYTNYFGLKDYYINQLALKCNYLIIDNAQAFYSKPINNTPTIYSPRKFFGVPDGGYLYCDKTTGENYKEAQSYDRVSHLVKRIDISAEVGYFDFLENEKRLSNRPIETMSRLTSYIMGGIDYIDVAKSRVENYLFLKDKLNSRNRFKFEFEQNTVPLSFPFWSESKDLRQKLIENKIFTAIYWPNVKEWTKKNCLEYKLCDEVIYLPIDQRYGIKEMELIIEIINK